MTLGWGIVGIGRVADTWMAPAINADPNSRIAEVVSRDQSRADAFAATHHASLASTSFDAMLDNRQVDVVLVTTPNALHPAQVIAAARAGKHVYCDKPLGLTVADARQAIEACAAAGVRLGMNFQTRHHLCFDVARGLIERGELGEISLVQVDTGNGGRRPAGWRLEPAIAGLGVVNNLAIHMYDLLRYLLGAEVTEVTALFDTGRAEAIELMALVLLRFSNGTLAYANGNQVSPFPLDEIVIHGTEGRIDGRGITRLGQEGDMRVRTRDAKTAEHYSNKDCYGRAVAAFSRAVLAGEEPNPSGRDGLRSVHLTEAITRSVREGRTIVLDPAAA